MPVSFEFNVTEAFLRNNSHPITILRKTHDRLRSEGIVPRRYEFGVSYPVEVAEINRATVKGFIYCGNSGRGPYYQIRLQSNLVPNGFLQEYREGDKIKVLLEKNANNEVLVRLYKLPSTFVQAPIIYLNEPPASPVEGSSTVARIRLDRFREDYAEAPRRRYEQQMQSVRISRPQIDPNTWLREKYTHDGVMHCQICKERMPFKYQGQYYFEAVEALDKNFFPREHEAQFLALCPICAAKYKLFIKNSQKKMQEVFNTVKGSSIPTIALALDHQGYSIRFSDSHFQRFKMIIEIESEN